MLYGGAKAIAVKTLSSYKKNDIIGVDVLRALCALFANDSIVNTRNATSIALRDMITQLPHQNVNSACKLAAELSCYRPCVMALRLKKWTKNLALAINPTTPSLDVTSPSRT